jgi:hypothetical protein
VRTSEDFGLQGEWPSHPELLDWLAVEFRQRGLSQRAMLRLLVTSARSARTRAAPPRGGRPDNRLLTWFPRRRLSAEAIRDQRSVRGGLLVERFGGPSVKPYQPTGPVAGGRDAAVEHARLPAGRGRALWRRSLYTYWKRACPPPAC